MLKFKLICMNRFSLCFAAISALSGCSGTDTTLGRKAPNVILILADDLGYNDVSVYRNLNSGKQSEKPPTSQTPNIDRLAGEGMLFTDFYSGAAVCSPSRAALLTGRNSTRTGIYNWIPENQPMHLRSDEITLAEFLKAKNYRTAHFGKWHLTAQGMNQPLPNDQGYDYSFFTFNNADPSHLNPINYFRNSEPVGLLEGYACDLVIEEATDWLKSNSTNGSPFYINIWFNEPHVKVAAPENLSNRHSYKKDYYGCIENMDKAIGQLLEFLNKYNLDKNTIVIFTSDNGSRQDHSNDPFRGAKHFNYEGGIRVPFIVRWPLAVPSGAQCDIPCSFTDIFPTMAQITGIPLPEGKKMDGIDISGVFKGEVNSVERKEPIFFFRYFHDPVCMIRDGEWCLLGYKNFISDTTTLNFNRLANVNTWNFDSIHMEYIKNVKPGIFELYNLKTDKEQKHNVLNEHPEIVVSLKKTMLEYCNEMITEGGFWY